MEEPINALWRGLTEEGVQGAGKSAERVEIDITTLRTSPPSFPEHIHSDSHFSSSRVA
jgi:hypothetical protein